MGRPTPRLFLVRHGLISTYLLVFIIHGRSTQAKLNGP
jgi:hypothetical protein